LWHWAADIPAAPVAPDNTTAYLTFFGGIVATLGLIAVAYINSRKDRNSSPTPPTPPAEDAGYQGKIRERLAVLESNHKGLSDDHDELAETLEVVDRRVTRGEMTDEQVIRFLDREYPDWRA
jgi:hypothetical protein